jgi:hypothetical protein
VAGATCRSAFMSAFITCSQTLTDGAWRSWCFPYVTCVKRQIYISRYSYQRSRSGPPAHWYHARF